MTAIYQFRPVRFEDLETLAGWLKTPAVARWFEDPDYIDDLEDHLSDDRICMEMVSFNAEVFAYIQYYQIHAWPDHPLSYLPPGAQGIDTFIGKPDMIGRGHGTAYLKQAVDRLFDAGVPAIGIDPHPENLRAISAYQRVGFKLDKTMETEWGLVQLLSCLR